MEPGQDLGEKLRSCIRRLVPDGGTCDALSLTGRQVSGSDPFVQNVGPLRVLLGDVTIEISQAWGLPSDTELAGRGSGTVLRLAPGVNSDFIKNAAIRGNHGIFIHDLTLDGNSASQGGGGSTIHLANVSGFTIERVTVLNSVIHGIALDHGCTRGRLVNNRIEDVSRGSAIHAGSAAPSGQVSFLDIRANKIAKVAKADGILVFGAVPGGGAHTHDVNILENTLTGVKGISIEVGDGSQKITVSGNKIELKGAPGGSSGATGIAVRSSKNVRVANNVVSGDMAEHDQLGMRAWSPVGDRGGPLLDVTMSENDVSDIAGYGILVDSGSAVHLVKNKVRNTAKDNIRIDPKATGVTQEGNNLP